MFIVLRFSFFLTIFIIYFILGKRFDTTNRRKKLVIVFVIVEIVFVISTLIPIENAFVTFPTAQSAYCYNHFGEIELIIDGPKTSFVIGKQHDSDIIAIIPKTKDGWKIGMGTDIKRAAQIFSDGISVEVYQYKGTDDYYISVLDTQGGLSDLTDNQNTAFQYTIKTDTALNRTFYTYFAYIESFDDQYTLTVNGKEIRLQS